MAAAAAAAAAAVHLQIAAAVHLQITAVHLQIKTGAEANDCEPMALTSQLCLLGWLVDDFGLGMAVNISFVIVHVMCQISRQSVAFGLAQCWQPALVVGGEPALVASC